MVTAQDKALAALCVERGLLDDEKIERARLAHANALESGGAPPLGQLLVQGGFLNARLASDLLRELALSSYRCIKCRRAWSYEALSQLGRYRCDGCGERLERVLRTPTGRFMAAPVKAEATEVLPRSISRGSSVSHVPLAYADRMQVQIAPAQLAPHQSGPQPAIATADEGMLQPGRRIGPYEVVSELGRGAMGIVYLAHRPGLERRFAIKVLLGGLLADTEAVERFRREAALASRVQHPAIVGVCDVGVVGGLHYYVMDFCAGKTLKAALGEKKTYPVREAVDLVAKIARGVAAAHALGIVHRDVKPANVILDARTNEPRIMDFGLARDASSSEVGMTRTGDIVGTPSYSSPEQLTGKRDVDARVDVYALGVVLYELIAGTRPFHADTVAHLAAIVLTEDARPLRSHVPDVPTEIDAIIGKAMAKAPDGRYPSAAELADDLERWLAGEAVSARPEGRASRLWRRKRLFVIAGVVAAVLSAGAGGAFAFVMRRSNEQAVRRVVERIKEIDQKAAAGEPFEPLSAAVLDLEAHAPAEARATLEVAWARVLHRRDRRKAALAAARPHVDAPGLDGLDAKRITACVLLSGGLEKDAAPLLAALVDSKNPVYADWVALRRTDAKLEALGDVRARVTAGSDGPSLRALAELLARKRENDAAIDILKKLVSNVARDDAAAHLALAVLLRAKTSDTASEAQAREAFDLFERFAGEEAAERPLALFHRATISLDKRDYGAMVRDLDAAIAHGLDTVEAHAWRGWILDDRGLKSRERAFKLLPERAKELQPQTGEVLAISRFLSPSATARFEKIVASAQEPARGVLGRALRASAEGAATDDVQKLLAEAATAAPRCPIVAREQARFFVSRFRPNAARAAITRARDVGAPEADLLLLETLLGVRSISVETALAASEKLTALGAGDARALTARAFIASQEGHPDDALRFAQEAVAAAPAEPSAHLALADAAYYSKDLDRAVLEARAALALEGRLDEENELMLLRTMMAGMGPAELQREMFRGGFGGMGGMGGMGGPRGRRGDRDRDRDRDRGRDDERRGEGLLSRLEKLESDVPSARVTYIRAMILLRLVSTNSQNPMANVVLTVLMQDLERAASDRESPIGEAGLAYATSFFEGEGREAREASIRSHFRKAREIDPTWRVPGNWVKPIQAAAPKAVEEYRQAPR